MKNATDTDSLKKELGDYLKEQLEEEDIPAGMSEEDMITSTVDQLSSPWFQFFMQYDPRPTLEKVKCPVLAINGEKDLQVPPKENLSEIEKALKKGGNDKFTILEMPNLNHLFQNSETGAPSEYASIEETFSPKALEEILKWIQEQIK